MQQEEFRLGNQFSTMEVLIWLFLGGDLSFKHSTLKFTQAQLYQ